MLKQNTTLLSYSGKPVAFFAILFLFLSPGLATAQSDTIVRQFKGYKWQSPALRVGGGLQRSLNTEIGFSWIWHEVSRNREVGNLIIYASHEWFPIHNIQAIKGGCDFNANAGILSLEMKYQFDQEKTDFVVTPRFGIGAGFFELFYGRNLSTNGFPFPAIYKNHFSVIFNLTGKFFKNYHKLPENWE